MPQQSLPAAVAGAAAAHQHVADPFIAREVVVSVPATSANLGPGFDCVALALDLRNTFEVSIHPRAAAASGSGDCQVELAPVSAGQAGLAEIETGSDNLFCQAFTLLCERRGVVAPDLRVRISAQIPPSRGLGSSATAVVGGLLAANTLLGQPLTTAELLELAVRCEPGGHADNVAAALLGGLVVTGASEAGIIALPLPIAETLRAVVFIPDMPMSTVAGRALLPERYTRGDLTFNLSRLALLLGALHTGRFDALGVAMDDRAHQPYREQLFPALRPLMAAARAGGAHGACLSGGGSSVLALASGAEVQRVCAALQRAAEQTQTPGHCVVVDISHQGARAALTTGLPDLASQASEGEVTR